MRLYKALYYTLIFYFYSDLITLFVCFSEIQSCTRLDYQPLSLPSKPEIKYMTISVW